MNFRLDLCIYMDNSLVVFLEKFSFASSFFFFVKNAKNNVFEDKWFWSKIVYQIKIQANTNWSSHREKHQTFEFFQTIDFYTIFKNRSLLRFLKTIRSTRKTHCKRLILCKHCRQNLTKLV